MIIDFFARNTVHTAHTAHTAHTGYTAHTVRRYKETAKLVVKASTEPCKSRISRATADSGDIVPPLQEEAPSLLIASPSPIHEGRFQSTKSQVHHRKVLHAQARMFSTRFQVHHRKVILAQAFPSPSIAQTSNGCFSSGSANHARFNSKTEKCS